MSRFGRVLGICGFVALLSVPLTLFLWDWALTWVAIAKIVFGVLAMLFSFLTNREGLREGFEGRPVFYGILNGLIVGVAFFVVVAANYMAYQHPAFLDLTANKIHSLSDQTVKLLDELDAPVQAKLFYGSKEPEYEVLRGYLDRYRVHSDLFSYEFIDPVVHLDLVERYKIKPNGPRILLVSGSKEERLKPGKPRFSGVEEALTTGLLALTRKGLEENLCFLTGHGEMSLEQGDPQRSMGLLARDLASEGYRTETLSLLENKQVPANCRAVVVAGAGRAVTVEELAAIKTFLGGGGELMVFVGAQDSPSLGPWLADLGFVLGMDAVVNPKARSPLNAVTDPSRYPRQHPIFARFFSGGMVKLRGLQAVFPLARSLSPAKGAAEVQVLASTGPSAWAERGTLEGVEQLSFDPEKDGKGPISLAAVTERPASGAAEGSTAASSRLVVFGSSLMVADQSYRVYPFNRDLVMNSLAWLLQEESKISIRPRYRAASLLRLDEGQLKFITFFSSDILPLLILALGISIWQVRKWA